MQVSAVVILHGEQALSSRREWMPPALRFFLTDIERP